VIFLTWQLSAGAADQYYEDNRRHQRLRSGPSQTVLYIFEHIEATGHIAVEGE
jgi:hypothetical protein